MSDQRLSVTFGAFSCDVVGYDDPFAILTRVVELFGEIAKSNPAFGAGEVPMSDMERAKLAAGLADQASRIDELADQSAPNGMRYIVSNTEADAPETAVVDDIAAEDEVIVAALAEDTASGSDLELLDTLEAVDSTESAIEEEVVALDIAPAASAATSAVSAEDLASEAPLELTEQIETPVIVDARTDVDERLATETVAADPVVAEAAETLIQLDETDLIEADVADTETDDLETINTIVENEVSDTAESIAALIAPHVEPKTDKAPARRPLRLNLNSHGVEPKIVDMPPKTAEVETAAETTKADEEPEKPQRRVTITKLPLRPEPPRKTDQPKTHTRHTLTPVQKVEPVVTFSANIGDSADETLKPSRAERIRANMEKRATEDDGENFLFSDVAETLQGAASADLDTAREQARNEPPLVLTPATSIESAPPEDLNPPQEPAKKSRRSIANLLGFGKNAAPSSEPSSEVSAPKAPTEDDYSGNTDGFVRLRESVAAAMPATEDQTVSHPSAKTPRDSISEAIDYDDETSPTAFARRVGANSLQDLLEASAVYMDVVEGKSRFSRRDIMQALNQIGTENDYTQEARLKSFRKLLTTGSLVRVDDGMFTVSQSTRFGYETRLQA